MRGPTRAETQTMTKVHEIRERIEGELAELEQMTAAAPEDHPARVALRTLRTRIEDGLHAQWYLGVERDRLTARKMANMIASGDGDAVFI